MMMGTWCNNAFIHAVVRTCRRTTTTCSSFHPRTSSLSSRRTYASTTVALLLAPTRATAVAAFSVPVYFDSTNHWHRDLQYHPEQPERIAVCVQALEQYRRKEDNDADSTSSVVELIDVAPTTDASTPFPDVECVHSPFSESELEHAKEMLMEVHDPDLVIKLEERSKKSKEKRIQDGKPALGHMGHIDFDTYLTTETFDVCLRAAAAWIKAADVAPGGRAMALMRPPGHHATRSSQNGFCLYNFAAATVAHILASDPNKRVSVIDWDVHYGQGVADILEGYDRARYVSIHQTPAFPYMGERFQIGGGPLKNIMTIPMPMDTTWTCGYEQLFDKAMEFACKSGEWEPDVVIICAGYDALGSDELASVSLNAEDYGRMTRKLIQHLEKSTSKRPALVLGLEGGYQLNPSGGCGNLQEAVVETVRALV